MDAPPVPPIRLSIRTAAPSDVAWRYLTDPDHVATWFTAASPLGKVGEPYVLDFGDGSVVHGSIVAVELGVRFAHRWAWLDGEPGQETLVEWSIAPLETGGCEIALVHGGWTEAGVDEAARDDHEAYWSGYLDDLRDLLDEAAGS